MKRYIKSENVPEMTTRYNDVDSESMHNKSDSEFFDRWNAKFGKPKPHTMRGDEFMKRLQEMVDFE